MAGYTRQSTFADGDTITAALFNNEYNQLVNAFSNTSGHAHDGTAANGPVIGLIGDAGETAPNNKVVIDTTNNYIEFYVEVSSSPVQQLYIADGAIIPVTDNDIDLGTSSLEFKDLYIDGTATIDTLTVDEAATIGTTLGVTGATTLSSTLGVTGATTLSSTLDVTGATTLSSTLAVTGTSTLTGNVTTTNDLSVGGNLTVTGNATISGNLTFGDADTDSITLTADVASNITPDVDDTYDLGTATKQWRNLYIDGTAEVDTLSIDGTAVTSTAAELNILDGVTATAAEINTLDGITATVAELNILDGVTSTATELNIVDGDTAATATTLADADRVVVNDAGVMKQVALTDFETYFEGALDTLSNVTTVGALNAGSITSGFGAIDNGSSNITTTGTVTYGSLSDGVITITAFADEDDMVSNSATLIPTQQSVKAYVDSQVATANELSELTDVNLTTPADASLLFYDTTTSKWIDNVVSGDITIADTGVAAISSGVIVNDDINASAAISVSKTALTAGTGLTLSTDTLAIDSTVATLTGTQTLTNKTLTSPVLNTGVSGTAFLDDDTFATATASTLASSESIKAYVDSVVGGVSSNSIADADGDTKIQVEESADEDIIRFDAAAAEIMTIDSSGVDISGDLTVDTNRLYVDSTNDRVGIALSTPPHRFSVGAANDDGIALYDGTNDLATIFRENNDQARFSLLDTGTVKVRLSSKPSDANYINNGGNVGIGTSSPDQLLHISAAADPAIRIENTDTTATAGQTIGKIEFEGQDASTNAAGVRALIDAQYAGVGGQGRLKFQLAQENSASLSDSLHLNYGLQQFFTNGSEAMRIDSSGNVLVGKTSSDNGATVGIEMTATDKLYVTDSASSPIIANRLASDGNVIAVQKDGTSVGVIGTQNWGIGTTSPDRALKIHQDNAYVWIADAAGGDVGFIGGSGANDGLVRLYEGTGHTAKVEIHSNSDSYFNGGNVGIGTNSPQGTLHVKNTSDSATLTSVSDSIVLSHQSGSYTDGNYYGVLGFSKANSNGATLGAAIAPVMDGTGAGTDLTFSTALAGGTCFEKMRITDTGNVGIGTTSPSFQNGNAGLHIVDATSPAIRLQDSNAVNSDFEIYSPDGVNTLRIAKAGTDFMSLDSSGVGIGTSSIAREPLHVHRSSTADCQIHMTNTSTGTSSSDGMTIFANSTASGIWQRENTYFRIATNNTERLRIGSTGQLDISPSTGVTAINLKDGGTGGTNYGFIGGGNALKSGGSANDFSFRTDTGNIDFYTNGQNLRQRITSGGVTLVNTTAAFSSGTLDVQGSGGNTVEAMGVKNNNSGSFNVMMKFYTSAGAVGRIDWDNTGSAMGFTNLSDGRLKNVTGEAKGLELINKLNPVKYYFKDNDWESEGLIAQEVEQTFEELDMPVKGVRKPDEDNEHYMLDYSVFTTNLIKAVKELSAEVDKLKNEIKLLKGGN